MKKRRFATWKSPAVIPEWYSKGIKMEYEEMEKLSLEESKRQTKDRRSEGLNMIRPFTFDEKKLLWDGLYNDGYKRKNILKEILIQELSDGDIQTSHLISLVGQTMVEY